jgi:hypothetical protein
MDAVMASRGAPLARPRKQSLLMSVLTVLFASLLLSILMEISGMIFLWPEQGATHSANMLNAEVDYLNRDFRQSVMNYSPVKTILALSERVYYWCFEFTHIETALFFLGDRVGVIPYIQAVVNITQLFIVRLLILVFSLPLFLVFAAVGGATGLSFRDIRRWSGGREFGKVFHHAKKAIPSTLFLSWIVYLSLPVSMHPNMIILPCAILFSINLMIMSASYKKYL